MPQPPPEALTLDEMLARLRGMAATLQVPQDQLERAEAALRQKYGSRDAG